MILTIRLEYIPGSEGTHSCQKGECRISTVDSWSKDAFSSDSESEASAWFLFLFPAFCRVGTDCETAGITELEEVVADREGEGIGFDIWDSISALNDTDELTFPLLACEGAGSIG